MTKTNEGKRCEDFRRHVLILFYIIHDKVTLCCGSSVYQRGEYFKSFVFVPPPSVSLFHLRCWLERDSEMKSKNRIRIDCERFHITLRRRDISAMYHRKKWCLKCEETGKRPPSRNWMHFSCLFEPRSHNNASFVLLLLLKRRSPLCVVLCPTTRYHWMQLQSKMEQDRVYVF